MNRHFWMAILLLFTTTCMSAQELITVKSAYTAKETSAKLKELLLSNNFSIIASINHSDAAEQNGIEMEYNELLIFGNPKVGSLLMQADPQIGVDLPLKILIWEADSKVFLSYKNPELLLEQYKIEEQENIIDKMKGALEKITMGLSTKN